MKLGTDTYQFEKSICFLLALNPKGSVFDSYCIFAWSIKAYALFFLTFHFIYASY
jgi:hypothetical protein